MHAVAAEGKTHQPRARQRGHKHRCALRVDFVVREQEGPQRRGSSEGMRECARAAVRHLVQKQRKLLELARGEHRRKGLCARVSDLALEQVDRSEAAGRERLGQRSCARVVERVAEQLKSRQSRDRAEMRRHRDDSARRDVVRGERKRVHSWSRRQRCDRGSRALVAETVERKAQLAHRRHLGKHFEKWLHSLRRQSGGEKVHRLQAICTWE
eukprot:Amastigsp_a681001_60.p2 type:complete len:212 gc:universal Amastigsp_a681001_60:76-711(+)